MPPKINPSNEAGDEYVTDFSRREAMTVVSRIRNASVHRYFVRPLSLNHPGSTQGTMPATGLSSFEFKRGRFGSCRKLRDVVHAHSKKANAARANCRATGCGWNRRI